MRPGIHLVHKRVGETSFGVVRAFMQEVEARGIKKLPLCHGGTLDPFAEGLLVVLAGQATRLMELLHPLPKSYVAEVTWGVETDNGDLLGRVVHEGDATVLTPKALDAALVGFLGWRDQVPPATSAKKIGGEPAYKKAHRGEKVELPPSRVYLHEARWRSHELPRRSVLELTCRGGYYVRALARDMGRLLGCGAHLSALRRTAIGPWEDPGPERRVWVHGEELLTWCPTRELTDEEADHLAHGRPIPASGVGPPPWCLPEGFPDPAAPVRALHQGKLVALLEEREGGLWSFANLRGGL